MNLKETIKYPDYFVKLDLEIAVDQQTKAGDRTPGDHQCPRDSHAHICGPILPNDLNMLYFGNWPPHFLKT